MSGGRIYLVGVEIYGNEDGSIPATFQVIYMVSFNLARSVELVVGGN